MWTAAQDDRLTRALRAIEAALSQIGDDAPKALLREALGHLRGLSTAGLAPTETRRSRLVAVDDDTVVRKALRRLLEGEYDVEVFERGDVALERLRRDPPDAVLLDVHLPGMSGIDVMAAMRADPRLCRLPVLLVTAQADDRHVADGIRQGADDYLVKPFRPAELRARIAAVLDRARELGDLTQRNAVLRGQAEVASELLHDMGNVLSGVGVTAVELRRSKGSAAVKGLERAGALVAERLSRVDEALRDDKDQLLPAYLVEIAKMMGREQDRQQAAAEELAQRVDVLRRMLARARGQNEGRSQKVDLHEVVEEALVVTGSVFRGAEVRVEVQVPTGTFVSGDPEGLQQVLVNLITNAVDAMTQSGTRRIRIESDATDGRWVRLLVTDTGSGIAPEFIGGVFERGVSTKGKSRGVGLHSCRRLVIAMGGGIDVHSRGVGQGATFTVSLPVAVELAAAS